ncbi:MAG: CaiB/BaiF CoA transferase family protein [Nocardioidaceae bacterium]
MTANRTGALDGIRVLDLSRILAGPYCAMMLADLGAEVIKVESPQGDDARLFGPFHDGESAYYRLFNRNKLGLSMDLKDPGERDRLIELARRSDVLIENFRPGVMTRLGLAPSELLRINPRLNVLSVTGYGQDGPLSDQPAYDLVAQAMSGLMSVTGRPGGEPTRTGVSLGDIIPGLYGAQAVLAALHERATTGAGQHIDVAMLDCLVSVLESVAMRALHGEEVPVATGNDHAMTAPFGTYRTGDGTIAIAVSNDRLFGRLADALERPEWLEDERFAAYPARDPHRDELRAAIEAALAGHTTEQAYERLRAHGVPAGKVLDVPQALAQDQVRSRGVVVEEPDGFATLGSPIRLTGSVPPTPAPQLGEHNDSLAAWLDEPERTGQDD